MPRTTSKQYHTRRHQLAKIWQTWKHDFAYLTSAEQCALHNYYPPTANLTDSQALNHRMDITRSHPSLPQAAGRAYAKLIGIRAGSIPIPAPETVSIAASRGHTRSRAISVRSVLRPKPDIERLVRALMSIKPDELADMLNRIQDKEPRD